jgi:hypothetical protein
MSYFKYLSDVENHPEKNSFAVEWEFEDGGRYWESFKSEQEMLDAIDKQQMELVSHDLSEILEAYRLKVRYINYQNLMNDYPYWKHRKGAVDIVKKFVAKHNALIFSIKNPQPSTFTLGDVFQKFGISIPQNS